MMSKLRILLVEDEAALRLVIRVALEKIGGFEVKCCCSGDEALATIDDFRPDLILLDVMMPTMDGPSTLRAIRLAGHESTPAIYLTARVQAHEVEALLNQGAIGVLRKPFDPTRLSEDLMALWETANLPRSEP